MNMYYSKHEDIDVLAQKGTSYYDEWTFTYEGCVYIMPVGIERQLIKSIIINKNFNSTKNILKNWKHEELSTYAFMQFFEDSHIEPSSYEGIDVLGRIGTSYYGWEFTYNRCFYIMPDDIECQLIQSIIIDNSFGSTKLILKNWQHDELSSFAFMQFFRDVHMSQSPNLNQFQESNFINTDTIATPQPQSQ